MPAHDGQNGATQPPPAVRSRRSGRRLCTAHHPSSSLTIHHLPHFRMPLQATSYTTPPFPLLYIKGSDSVSDALVYTPIPPASRSPPTQSPYLGSSPTSSCPLCVLSSRLWICAIQYAPSTRTASTAHCNCKSVLLLRLRVPPAHSTRSKRLRHLSRCFRRSLLLSSLRTHCLTVPGALPTAPPPSTPSPNSSILPRCKGSLCDLPVSSLVVCTWTCAYTAHVNSVPQYQASALRSVPE